MCAGGGSRPWVSEPFPVAATSSRCSCGPAVLVVEQNEGGGGDRADAPGAEADPAQRLECGLEQGVAAFGRGPGGRVQQVDGALIVGQRRVGASLDRRGQRRPLTFVAQVCQGGVV